MIFDSHAHYNDSRFDTDRFDVLNSMTDNNVAYIMNVADSMKSIPDILSLCERYPFIYASVGVHPENAGELCDEDIERLEDYTHHPKVLAIGEIGLDYHYDDVPKLIQKKWFIRQIELAKKVNLPIIVHDRDAHADCLQILKECDVSQIGGVMHCFSASAEMAAELIKLGMYIGFGGTLTFKNAAKVVRSAESVPLSKILVETDCPYLAPEPKRGQRNASPLIRYVLEKLSEIKGISVEEAERVTFENAKRFYGIEG